MGQVVAFLLLLCAPITIGTLILLGLSVFSSGGDDPATPKYPGGAPLGAPSIEKWVIHYTNEEREAVGLRPLTHDLAISDISRAHSENMVHFGRLSHVIENRDPTNRALNAGYDCRAYKAGGSYTYGLSENLAKFPRVRSYSGTRWSIRPEAFYGDAKPKSTEGMTMQQRNGR